MDNKAQASLEYLILVAVIIAIAALVAFMVKSTAGGQGKALAEETGTSP